MLALFIESYLLGSIPFGYIIAWKWRKVDISKIGSKNVGTTNVFKQIGIIPGLMTAVFDALKGIAAVTVGGTAGVAGEFIALIAAMIGHNWPVWLGFHGGGGLATFIGGMLLVSSWWVVLILLGIWGITYLIIKTHDHSALATCCISPVVLGLIHSSWNYFLFGAGAALVVGMKRLFSIKKKNMVAHIENPG